MRHQGVCNKEAFMLAASTHAALAHQLAESRKSRVQLEQFSLRHP